MRTIEVEEDIYTHIAKNTHEIGESASVILRRLMGLPMKGDNTPDVLEEHGHELLETLLSPTFRAKGTTVRKFLHILGVAHNQKPQAFVKVLAVQGRDRRYFAKSRVEIIESGRKTQPFQIPSSPYWVMTNSPTRQKQQMLRQVLKLLEYSDAAVNAAVAAIH